jgi:hypothetical protein
MTHDRALAVFAAALSVAVVLAEATISPKLPNLSIFSRALHGVEQSQAWTEVLCCLSLAYPIGAAYYGLYKCVHAALTPGVSTAACVCHSSSPSNSRGYDLDSCSHPAMVCCQAASHAVIKIWVAHIQKSCCSRERDTQNGACWKANTVPSESQANMNASCHVAVLSSCRGGYSWWIGATRSLILNDPSVISFEGPTLWTIGLFAMPCGS